MGTRSRGPVALATVVVAHPARHDAAKRLAERLDAHLVVDDLGLGEWGNHARALEWAAQQPASHTLIVQDDAEPIPGMLEHAATAATLHPVGPIGLYVGRTRPRRRAVQVAVEAAEQTGASWLEADTLLWGVATILPTHHVPELLTWADGRAQPYDERVGDWYRSCRIPVRYVWPSLVDHADWPSVIPNRARKLPRRAWRTGAPSWGGPVQRIRP